VTAGEPPTAAALARCAKTFDSPAFAMLGLGILDAGENVRRRATPIHTDDERLLALELQNIASMVNELHSALYDVARIARTGADTQVINEVFGGRLSYTDKRVAHAVQSANVYIPRLRTTHLQGAARELRETLQKLNDAVTSCQAG
jgi:hypothetical protein